MADMDLAQYLDDDNSILDSAPDEVKAFYYRISMHAAAEIYDREVQYCKSHPKTIDIKITDITEIPISYSIEMGNLAADYILKTLNASKELLKQKYEEMYNLKEITDE